ncbi:MAG: FAD-dependent thymidylate synthase [Patescibacteria group bacterium]|nr:FAD-dependent thymidylate synthase [Patescibacteria group bacterium]
MPIFTPEEIELLKKYVTDPTGDVFCVTGMQGMVGAAYARYSRARGGFRETLLKEFIKEGVVDPKHAAELIQRVLIAFGDDSVGELEGTHLSTENVTIIATKEMEECRIGGSPIEQSTRYVFYDQKDEAGNYRYYRDPNIVASKHGQAYIETMDFFFQTYCELIEPMKKYYQKLKPLKQAEYDIKGTKVKQRYDDLTDPVDQKAFKTTYQMDIRTRACDTLRYILPLSTKTNVGWFGNGRFYQGFISALLSSPFPEAQTIGKSAALELAKIIPAYVRRAKANEYQSSIEKNMYALAVELLKDTEPMADENISLLDFGENYIAHKLSQGYITLDKVKSIMQDRFDNVTLAMMLYAYCRHPLKQLIKIVEKLPVESREKIINTYIGERKTRRDRPYRAFEAGYPYTFDLVTDFGVYKDVMRHRMTSQLKQRFSPLLGFTMPPDIIKAGFEDKIKACHEKSMELYNRLYPDFPSEASYATLHGSKVRWLLAFNEREAYHLLELRTGPQGHPAYRKVCQELHRKIQERSDWRADHMKFVDYNQYDWARADSEAKQRVKERELDEKIAKDNKKVN